MSKILLNKNSENAKENLNKVLQNIIQNDGINNTNIIFIVTNLMTDLSHYTNIPGKERKQIIISLLENAVNTIDYDEEIKAVLNIMIKTIVPSSIDLIIDIAKGRYNFDNIQKKTKKCYTACCFSK